MQEMQIQTLGRGAPLEESTATHSSILAWRLSRTEELCGLVHGVTKSPTPLKQQSIQAHIDYQTLECVTFFFLTNYCSFGFCFTYAPAYKFIKNKAVFQKAKFKKEKKYIREQPVAFAHCLICSHIRGSLVKLFYKVVLCFYSMIERLWKIISKRSMQVYTWKISLLLPPN